MSRVNRPTGLENTRFLAETQAVLEESEQQPSCSTQSKTGRGRENRYLRGRASPYSRPSRTHRDALYLTRHAFIPHTYYTPPLSLYVRCCRRLLLPTQAGKANQECSRFRRTAHSSSQSLVVVQRALCTLPAGSPTAWPSPAQRLLQ